MRLEIRSKGLEVGSGLRDSIRRRLRFVLGRFGSRVRRVTVDLADANAPAGGADKGCRIVALLAPNGRVCVEVRETDLGSALTRAAERVGPAVSRELLRRRDGGG
jgi:hypothetical protein